MTQEPPGALAPPILTTEIVERWMSIPESATVTIMLSRRDLDELFIGMRAGLRAQNAMASFIVYLSNQDLESATKMHQEFLNVLGEASHRIDTFIAMMMVKAQQAG